MKKLKSLLVSFGILILFIPLSPVCAFGEKMTAPVEYRQSNDLILKDPEQIQNYLNNPSTILTVLNESAQPFGPEPVRKIFLKVSQQILKQRSSELQKLLEFCHLQNKEIYFYLGAPQYATDHGEPILIWDALLTYQKNNPSTAKFDGAFLDIRPYLLPDWKKNSSAIMKRYQSLIKTLKIQRIFTNEKFPIVITMHPSWIFQNPDTTDAYIYELLNYANAVAYDAGVFEFWELEPSFKKTTDYLAQIKAPLYLLLNIKTMAASTAASPRDYLNFQKENLMRLYQLAPGFESLLWDDSPFQLRSESRNQINQQFKAALKMHPIDGNYDDWDFKIDTIADWSSATSRNAIQAVLHHNANYLYLYFEIPVASSNDTLHFWVAPYQLKDNPFQKSLYHFRLQFEKNSGVSLQSLDHAGMDSPVAGSVVYDRILEKMRLVELAIPKKYFLMQPESGFPAEFLFGYRLSAAELPYFKTHVLAE